MRSPCKLRLFRLEDPRSMLQAWKGATRAAQKTNKGAAPRAQRDRDQKINALLLPTSSCSSDSRTINGASCWQAFYYATDTRPPAAGSPILLCVVVRRTPCSKGQVL